MASPYRAVVFDLFGTLIPSMSPDKFEQTLSSMADTLSADSAEFTRQWIHETWDKRRRGVFKTVGDNIEYICRSLGLKPTPDAVTKAVTTRHDYTRSLLLHPIEDTLLTLKRLRENRFKIGLLSNCSADVPDIWPETDLSRLIDYPVFSCSVGFVKPEPESYQLVSKALGTRPSACAYVGDGSDMELTGAQKVGVYPILLKGPQIDPYDEQLDRQTWKGPTITRISDLVNLIS